MKDKNWANRKINIHKESGDRTKSEKRIGNQPTEEYMEDMDEDSVNLHPEQCEKCGSKMKQMYVCHNTKCQQQGFKLKVDGHDDLVVIKDGKPILKISLPEKSTQWNCELPA